MENKFNSTVSNVEQLGIKRFIIPSYQRPFVWDVLQIEKLLSDFYDSYYRNDNHYFIGTILTSKIDNVYELIDGQQRFTALWLISVSFKILGKKTELLNFLKSEEDLRFDFAIRNQVKAYLLSLLEMTKREKNQYSNNEVENDEYIVKIAKAVTTITNNLENMTFRQSKSIEEFGDYIYKNIQFVLNTAPTNTNLNKLFATINDSGIQLEQSDILKSKLLYHLSDRIMYSKIWEACENMENYFERNVRDLFPETNWMSLSKEDFNEFRSEVFKYKIEVNSSDSENGRDNEFDISQINIELIKNNFHLEKYKKANKNIILNYDPDKIFCRSIINFSQLLLHTLRIYLKEQNREDYEIPFHTKNLLEIFQKYEDEGKDFIEGFFYCLWRVRYVFDRDIVKWIQKSDDKDEELMITSVSNSDKDKTRYFTRSHSDFRKREAMLQSVLYFTGNYNTQIWMSPFLKRLLEGEEPLECLELIDNQLSLSLEEDKPTTYKLMDRKYRLLEKFDYVKYLNESNGTSFKHYWFQKLEYILWKNWEEREDPKFKEFRIVSKNSVEHVFPQNHEFGVEIEHDALNNFGNLGLLSVSQNSSYSHQDVKKKKVDFDAKSVYDSLKLYHIYKFTGYEHWTAREIFEHRDEMIEKIKQHYENRD